MAVRRKILVAVLLLVVLFIVVVPAGIAYASLHPERCHGAGTPADYGHDYENFTLVTADGVTLKGWIIPGTRPTVFIVMHGYTSCKADERLLRLQATLAEKGYTVVAFDFRGHGESGGTTTIGPKESEFDVPTVLAFVEEKYPGHRIVLLGYSMGAVAAIMAGSKAEGDITIIADSPYPSLDQVIPRWLKSQVGVPAAYSKLISLWGSLLAGVDTRFGPIYLGEIDKPLLVIAGDRDPLVTPEEARIIAEKSCCGKAVVVEGAGHVEAYKVMGFEKYVEMIVEFAETRGR